MDIITLMDMVTIHQQIVADGFRVSISDIESLTGQFKVAVAIGKIKQSTAPDRYQYPLGQVVAFLLKQPKPNNVSRFWDMAIETCPKLAEFKTSASYSKNVTHQKTSRVASMPFIGVLYLSAALSAERCESVATEPIAEPIRANRQIMEKVPKIDYRIPVIHGYVYVLRDIGNRIIKLGFTSDPDVRLSHHRSTNPFLIPIALFPVNSQVCETVAHDLLKPYLVTGTRQWYYDKPEVLEAISKLFFI
jgi:hypothetical protein